MLQNDSCQCITGPQEVFPDDKCLFCSLNAWIAIEEDEQYVYSDDEEFDYCRACGADFDICTCYDADSEPDFWWPHQLDFNCTDSHFSGWDSTPGDPNVGSNDDRDYDDDYYYDSDSLSFEQENMEYWDRHCEFVADVEEQGYGVDFEADT